MPHAFKASEINRRAQDGGDSARAQKWFSSRTVQASGHYRDWRWTRIAAHLAAAVSLIAVSRIDPSWALAPWMLISGVIWALWGAKALIMKLVDRQ